MKTIVNKRRQLVGLLYGLAAGLAFSLFAWGIDFFLLANAHGYFSWVRFVPGLLISLILGGLVGWLTVRIKYTLVNLFFWVCYALILSKLIVWLPIKATPFIIKLFNGYLGDFLDYPNYPELSQIRWFGFATIVVVCIINAILENILIDQALFSTGKVAIIVPLIVCSMSFGLVGSAADGIFNKATREPILAVETLMDFAASHLDQEVAPELKRSMHLAAVNTIKEYLPRDRRLILSNFDRSFGQIDVLIDFEGYWVKCTTVYNQVTFCTNALETPQSLFSHFKSSAMVIMEQEVPFLF